MEKMHVNPQLVLETSKIEKGSVKWRSPSNLAVIKYWGKYGRQLPRNPSISFTLDKAYTETSIEYQPKTGVDRGVELDFFFGGDIKPEFGSRVQKYLEDILDIFPFLRQLKLTIHSSNSFPHSSGIASSASSMSALALCLCSLEREFFDTLNENRDFLQKASFVARLGSGSACRSVYSEMAIWGESGEVEGSSNLHAVPFADEVHEVYRSFCDRILIISKGKKSVSSRAGHGMMDENPYAESRYEQARRRFHNLLHALKTGDLESFGQIAEAEAMTLHALMMTSNPPYILMQPNTLEAINRVRSFRRETQHPVYFSLDAGPNLHLLFPESIAADIDRFIASELLPLCENERAIEDGVGKGPIKL